MSEHNGEKLYDVKLTFVQARSHGRSTRIDAKEAVPRKLRGLRQVNLSR